MNNNLIWSYVDDGRWEAYSIFQDDGNPFVWVITVTESGYFTLNQSDAEVLPKENKFRNVEFSNFKNAKIVCDVIESNYRLDYSLLSEDIKDMFGIQV